MSQKWDPRFFPNLPPRDTDPFTGAPLVVDTNSQQGQAAVQQALNPAKIGNRVALSLPASTLATVPTTVAEYRCPDYRPRSCVVTISVETAPTQGSIVCYLVTWGIGGATFTRSMYGNFRHFTLDATYIRIDVVLAEFQTTNADTATVVGQIAPYENPRGGRLSAWNCNPVPNPFNPFIPIVAPLSLTGSDSYVLIGGVAKPQAGAVRRVEGARYDAGSAPDVIMLFDVNAVTLPISNGTAPIKILGSVIGGDTFSWDAGDEEDGIQCSSGCVIAASSTGNTYTRDATAKLAVDWQVDLG